MTKTYAWTTARGAKIDCTITAEHITSKTVNADGHEIETTCSEYRYSVNSLKIKGKENAEKRLSMYRNENVIVADNKIMVLVPKNIANEIYGDERAEMDSAIKASARADAKYAAHCKMMRRAMDTDA